MAKRFPKTTKIVIEVDTQRLLADFASEVERSLITPDNYEAFVKELTRDIEAVSIDNCDFFSEGINNDCYMDFYSDEEEEDDEDED